MRFDHIDLRVRDVRKARKFYDALLPALGATKRHASESAAEWFHAKRHEPFFGIHNHRGHVANKSRIAFAADARKDVDRIAAVMRRAGAKEIEGPAAMYTQPYYVVFFEDSDGNKFEVCCRT